VDAPADVEPEEEAPDELEPAPELSLVVPQPTTTGVTASARAQAIDEIRIIGNPRCWQAQVRRSRVGNSVSSGLERTTRICKRQAKRKAAIELRIDSPHARRIFGYLVRKSALAPFATMTSSRTGHYLLWALLRANAAPPAVTQKSTRSAECGQHDAHLGAANSRFGELGCAQHYCESELRRFAPDPESNSSRRCSSRRSLVLLVAGRLHIGEIFEVARRRAYS
jgi:hypothetical protein